ncbi:MAG: hypothetical protein WB562_10730 [Candidatus Sulfotelmatobacter sp.]
MIRGLSSFLLPVVIPIIARGSTALASEMASVILRLWIEGTFDARTFDRYLTRHEATGA